MYAVIPRDVTKIKRKIVAGLTRRQLICFGIAAAIGVPLFFLLRKPLGSTAAAYIMIFTMMPAMLFALYEKNGMPLEQYLRCMFQVMFIRSKERPYRTDNLYDVIYYDILLEKEVEKIVETAKKKSGDTRRGKRQKKEKTKANQASNRKAATGRTKGRQGSKSSGGSGA